MSSTCKLLDLDDDQATLSTGDDSSLDDSRLDEEIRADCLKTSRTCSSIIGFMIGMFIQGSTLGLNFLIASIGDGSPTLTAFVNVTVMWSVFASTLGVAILFLMRSLVVSAFYSTNDPDSYDIQRKESFMREIISTLEKFYAVGALGGVGVAWCLTDLILDIKSHLLHSILTFLVATLWYCCS